jgi:hypothetical protein
MAEVRVSFTYTPDDPDDDDPTGVSSAEYETVTDQLMQQFGAENIEFAKIG